MRKILRHLSLSNHRLASTTPNPSQKMAAINKTAHPFSRPEFETLLSRRFFYAPAFEIYGGIAGFYDYGPPGSSLQSNILQLWRQHFIIEEEMLEIESTCLTMAEVLKTSGHVDKFTDWMTKDKKTGDIFRADHLVEAVLEARLKGNAEARGETITVDAEKEAKSKKKKVKNVAAVKLEDDVIADYENTLAQIDNFGGPELGQLIQKHNIKAPETGNDLAEPVEFNLMFDTQIGPTGQSKGYLRPETAQGHFTNFGRLLEFNNGRVPFASAQIGKSFRNEISPRQGLLRVREFVMAEIEHFVDPKSKQHSRFDEVKDLKLTLLDRKTQLSGKTDLVEMTIGEAVEKGIVDNQTLGYFMARIHLFMLKIGIIPSRMRFRQHMANEMAHYAQDCWDCEIHSSYGWIECVGCADRSAYDLTVHGNRTNRKMVVKEALPEPIIEERWKITLDKKKFGPAFKGDAKAVELHLLQMEENEQEAMQALATDLSQNGKATVKIEAKSFEVPAELLQITQKTTKVSTREFVPNVIEPSFGIGRILYSLLEHAYWAREEDIQRGVLSFPPAVAPIKVLVVPISANDSLRAIVKEISARLRRAGVSSRVDDSSAGIGKRYARNDELGTPFGITVDFASVKNGTITLRERDSMAQRIGEIEQVVDVIRRLSFSEIDWSQACDILPEYSGTQDA